MKKNITLLIFLILCFKFMYSQIPNYGWADRAGKSGAEDAKAITIDHKGNVYAIGSFTSDSITFGNITLANLGNSDVFIVKYDSIGNVVWAKRISASGDEYGRGIAVDKNENVYITGYFSTGSITFGNSTLTNSSPGTQNIFIGKIDSSGNKDWGVSIGGSGNDYGQSISIDTFGYLYVTGNFYSSSITVGSTTLTQAGGSDMCLMKYDKNGIPVWAKSAGGSGYEHGFTVTNDLTGNCIVSGVYFSSTITFGSTNLTNSGGGDIFLTKYDSQGNVMWAIKAGGNANDDASSVCSDLNGNLYLVGGFRSSLLAFGSIATLTNFGNSDYFITKIDASGNFLWAKGAGGSNDEFGQSVTRDLNGNVLVTGTFGSPSITLGSTQLINNGIKNIFIVGYNSSGNELWTRKDGGNGADESFGISSWANGKAYITGKFSTNLLTLGTISLVNKGSTDFFIGQLVYEASPCSAVIYDTTHIIIYDTIHSSFGANNSLYFDGYNDKLIISPNSNLEAGNNPTTISFWAKFGSIPSGDYGLIWGSIGANQTFTQTYYSINVENTGLIIKYSDGTNTVIYSSNNNVFLDNHWHSFLITIPANRSVPNLYIEGNQQSLTKTQPAGSSDPVAITDGDGFGIACDGDSSHPVNYHYFHGNIYGFSVWNRELTSCEIQLYSQCVPNGNENGLAAYWDFHEGSGTLTTDVKNNIQGQLLNGVSWSNDVPLLACRTYDTIHIAVYDTLHTYISVTDTLIVSFQISGVNPPNDYAAIKVYPNPASDHLYVNTGNYANLTGYKFKITNSLSQVVFVAAITQQLYSVDLSNWTGNGTYFISILDATNNIVEVKKIILQ